MTSVKLPLNDFSNWHGEVNGIEISSTINLPEYAPAERITVDLGRIATIARFGRLAALEFRSYSGESTAQGSAMISGVNQDGSAVAVRASVAAVARSRHSLERAYEPDERYPRARAQIGINTSHPDIQRAKVRTPEPWARLLDKGIGDGLVRSSRNQLFKPSGERKNRFVASKVGAIIGCTLLTTFSPDMDFSDMHIMLPTYLAVSAGLDATGIYRKTSAVLPWHGDIKHPEKSFFEHLPVDRYFAAKALSKRSLVSVASKA